MKKDNMPVMLERKVIYESDWVELYSDKVKMPAISNCAGT